MCRKINPFTVCVENKSALDMMKNTFHCKSKHIYTKYRFIYECMEKVEVFVKYVGTNEQQPDSLTKPMCTVTFKDMRKMLGVTTA